MAFHRASDFFQHVNHHQLLDNITVYHNMHNQQKLTHIEQENGLKPHFGPFLALIGPFLGQQIFIQHLDSHQILDIVILNHNMHNQQKLTHTERENGLKPHFGPFFALIGPFLGKQIFFSALGQPLDHSQS